MQVIFWTIPSKGIRLRRFENRDLKVQRRVGNKNVAKKVNLRSFSLYRDYSLVPTCFVCQVNPPELNSKGSYQSSEREIKFRLACLRFP